ncbi:MAG: hypothetical protein UY23_C0001G0106 [Candidatus Jorgensenbacteria bacterium GW2011_GWA1_48_11]|uniref:O-antigen ligase-related domain-containing protein n=1 Tax=Candidatus Jorgensenbacteria bacterium GW2011_GWA1_48_11 TaxID=1618660 RepID=A0A0G1XAY4_9BACT|nr:MAG: hypothetical protein UY23_C0001G0106 [Candidatus Jorgensenbacteria bacterium GW2011_GWA1_48_11]KKW11993.1 MAG: hypothetical protein UY51_C0005G0235 [Candidatus Jorgensenbacteria bacterium GW2011_GWB1_49_9]
MNYFKVSKFFLYISVLAIALVTTSTLFPFIVGKYVWFRTTVDLALIAFLMGLLFSSEAETYKSRLVKFLKSPLVMAVTVFAFVFVLAGFFGFDPANSFWSNFERGEGGLQMLHLLAFFWLLILLFRDQADWRKIFWSSVIAGLLMVGYGVGASLKYLDADTMQRQAPGGGVETVLTGEGGPFYQAFKDFVGAEFNERFQGSIGNPAYVAAYAIFMLFYLIFLFIYSPKRKWSFGKLVLCLLGAVFLVILYWSGTRGAFLGFVAAVVGFLGYFIYVHRPWRKWLIGGLFLVILAVSLMITFQNTPFVKSLPASRIFNITFATETFSTRTIMWQIAWEGWKARPLLGWGPENYLQVFDRHFDIRYFSAQNGFGAWFDRAHSIYFDYLVETGALGFLSFLSIFVILYWHLWKRIKADSEEFGRQSSQPQNRKEGVLSRADLVETGLMVALPIAYLVQGIVLFDVLPIYINVFLFLAFASYKFSQTRLTIN